MDWPKRYRVLVEYEDGDSWDKSFYDAHEALDFYRRCADARITLMEKATVKAQRLDDGVWKTVFKSVIDGSIWY